MKIAQKTWHKRHEPEILGEGQDPKTHGCIEHFFHVKLMFHIHVGNQRNTVESSS